MRKSRRVCAWAASRCGRALAGHWRTHLLQTPRMDAISREWRPQTAHCWSGSQSLWVWGLIICHSIGCPIRHIRLCSLYHSLQAAGDRWLRTKRWPSWCQAGGRSLCSRTESVRGAIPSRAALDCLHATASPDSAGTPCRVRRREAGTRKPGGRTRAMRSTV